MTQNRSYRPKTLHEFSDKDTFDSDIRGLHRIVQPAKILGKKVRYVKPGLPQAPYMINFLIEAFQDLIMSGEERSKFNRNEIFSRVINYVIELTSNLTSESESEENEAILGSAFGSRASITYLIPVMQQCFPDIKIQHTTNEAFIECFNLIFSDLFDTEEES